jgi:hypothetical protein
MSLVAFVAVETVSAQPVDVPATWGGSFWDRPRLTGSWFGLRVYAISGFGDNVSNAAGTLLPPNLGTLLPSARTAPAS